MRIDSLRILWWLVAAIFGAILLIMVFTLGGCAINFGSGQTEATYMKEDVISGTNDVRQFRLR